MAYEKFRKCPLDDSIMENLYNLALDFERKRQFNKAQAVYEYMSSYNPKFRDLPAKLSRAKTMSETIILGGSNTRTNASLISGDAGGTVEKPMLGRYQVDKELGKGAMGVVYLGRDPKIGRVVAIKTMALAQEFEPDELQDVKDRFFREAETAGRLNHPNIVTIFDAGEEHDLAYIAMEFLKGKDLVPFTKPDNLLPLERVVSIHARVSEALAYAHRLNVVHRDIKPANVMYELESDTVKVTDFGIARITDSSRTKTGMVLGTPSYMSPEQLSGMKIDGRSDLFSLAVSLFQMSCGRRRSRQRQLLLALRRPPRHRWRVRHRPIRPWMRRSSRVPGRPLRWMLRRSIRLLADRNPPLHPWLRPWPRLCRSRPRPQRIRMPRQTSCRRHLNVQPGAGQPMWISSSRAADEAECRARGCLQEPFRNGALSQ
jgi:serine/threonine protein kinase